MLEAVSGKAHNLEVGGSIPSTATKIFYAPLAELVDALDLGSSAVRCGSSSLPGGTKLISGIGLMVKRDPSKFKSAVRFRYPAPTNSPLHTEYNETSSM